MIWWLKLYKEIGGAIIDGGKSWALQKSGTETTLFGISFPSARLGVAVGLSSAMLWTEDGGRSWKPIVQHRPRLHPYPHIV